MNFLITGHSEFAIGMQSALTVLLQSFKSTIK